MKRINLFLTFLLLCVTTFSKAQVTQVWVKISNPGSGKQITVDRFGNVYAAGWFNQQGTCVIKYNPANGDTLWVRRAGGVQNFQFSICTDSMGNVLAANDNFLLKYSPAGTQLLYITLGGPVSKIITGSSDNIYVTGSANNNFYTAKYNSGGTQQWVAVYDSPYHLADTSVSLVLDRSGNLFVTGNVNVGMNVTYICTIRYNSNTGDTVWTRIYPNLTFGNHAVGIGTDNAGNVYVAGTLFGYYYGGGTNFLALKYSPLGNLLWDSYCCGGYRTVTQAYVSFIDSSGNTTITGTSRGPNTTAYPAFYTARFNPSGSLVWSATTHDTDSYSTPHDIKLDPLGNSYITGEVLRAARFALRTIKYSPGGAFIWEKRYADTAFDDRGNSVALDASGNIYVTGETNGWPNLFTTIKYSQLVGIQPFSNEVPKDFLLEQNYPNPFNAITKFKVKISESRIVTLAVFDVSGKIVSQLIDHELKPGTYIVDFDGTNFPSGLYLYRLTAGDYSETRKMVLLK